MVIVCFILTILIPSSLAQGASREAIQQRRESVNAEAALGDARSLVRKRNYTGAEEVYERALEVIRSEKGPKSRLAGEALIELGLTRIKNGRSGSGISALREALAILEVDPGREAPITAGCMNRLGLQLIYHAAFNEAEPLLQQALQIRRKIYKDQSHPEVAASLGNLGLLYFKMGAYNKAKLRLQEAEKEYEKTTQPGSSYYIGAMNVRRTLASLYQVQGEYREAERLLERVLEDTSKQFGADSREVAEVFLAYGELEMLQKHFKETERYIRKALKIQKAKLPAKHEQLLRTKNSLAVALQYQGRYDEALKILRDLLEVSHDALGENHPLSISIQNNIGMTFVTLGETALAQEHARQFLKALRDNLGDVLAYFPEDRRLGYMQNMDFSPYDLVATLGDGPLTAEAVLTFKGAVLESVTRDRRRTLRAGSDNAKLMGQIQALRQQFLEAQLADDTNGVKQLADDLETKERALSRALGEQFVSSSLQPTRYQEVSARLPENAVLLEYFFYDKHLGGNGGWKAWCGAVALARGREPVFRELGPADPILKSIGAYMGLASDESTKANSLNARAASSCQNLFKTLIAPFTKILPPDGGELLICPDGRLNFVSFATLLDSNDTFVGSRYQIRYLDTGRVFLEEDQPKQTSTPFVALVGDPDFEFVSEESGKEIRDQDSTLPLAVGLPRLPGTGEEVEQLETLFRKHEWKTEALCDAHATERNVRALLEKADVVHLATHAYFRQPFSVGSRDNAASQSLISNPMLRSWLVLAGAKLTLKAWQNGRAPSPANDGILMADEIAGLNLKQADLVVLSACDTVKGEARNGEGILGLRRGFALAGVRNLLLTAWKIDDEYAAKFMKPFYEAIVAGAEPAAALHKVQADQLTQLRKERGTLSAIHLAGPFLLTSFEN